MIDVSGYMRRVYLGYSEGKAWLYLRSAQARLVLR